MALYRGMALERVDHYVDNLSYMAYEKKLDAICEDVDPIIVVSKLLLQASGGLNLYFAQFYFSYSFASYFILSSFRHILCTSRVEFKVLRS